MRFTYDEILNREQKFEHP